MSLSVTQRPRARLDLLEQFVYFGEQGSVEVAERYFDAIGRTCAFLAQYPHAGKHYDSGISRLSRLRRFPVKDFENYFVFYIPRRNSLEIIRVLHAARDIGSLLAEEF